MKNAFSIESDAKQVMCEVVGLVGDKFITIKTRDDALRIRVRDVVFPFAQVGDTVLLTLAVVKVTETTLPIGDPANERV